jgi:signal transduction histidine kinase
MKLFSKLSSYLFTFDDSWQEDKQRRSYLLNTVTVGLLIFLICIFSIRLFGNYFLAHENNQESLLFLLIIIGVLSFLTYLVKRGFVTLVSLGLVALLLLATFKGTLSWGIDLYTVDIMYPFIILLSAILISSHFSFFVLLLVILTLTATYYLQHFGLIPRNSEWRNFLPSQANLLTILVIYSLMTFLSWLSSREIEKSLLRVRALAEKLRMQNENLELIVKERTKKLRALQLEQLTQAAPLIDLGKLAAGLVHDIKQPLSVLSMLLESFQKGKIEDKDLDLAHQSIERINELASFGANEFFIKEDIEIFNLNKEIKKLVELFSYKARKFGVKILIISQEDFTLHADRKKLLQIIANLIINGLEAHKDKISAEKIVFVKLKKQARSLIIEIKDTGVGIDQKVLQTIFQPGFSTKSKKRSLGLGLYIANELMQKFFHNQIKVISKNNQGSSFFLLIKNKYLLEA